MRMFSSNRFGAVSSLPVSAKEFRDQASDAIPQPETETLRVTETDANIASRLNPVMVDRDELVLAGNRIERYRLDFTVH